VNLLNKKTMGHIDTYFRWNESPNCRILFFTCFTNSSQSLLLCGTPSSRRRGYVSPNFHAPNSREQ